MKLTAAFLRANHVAFLPASEGEAAHIQRELFKLGQRWKSGGAEVANKAQCVTHGIYVEAGVIYTLADNFEGDYLLFRAGDLGYSVAQHEATRIDALEKQVRELRAALSPKKDIKLPPAGMPKK